MRTLSVERVDIVGHIRFAGRKQHPDTKLNIAFGVFFGIPDPSIYHESTVAETRRSVYDRRVIRVTAGEKKRSVRGNAKAGCHLVGNSVVLKIDFVLNLCSLLDPVSLFLRSDEMPERGLMPITYV